MNMRRKTSKKRYLQSISSRQWTSVLVAVSILLVLLGTLSPFQWSDTSHLSYTEILDIFFNSYGTPEDLIINVFLFLPLGFGVAAILWQKWSGRVENLFISGLLSLSLSLAVEILQLFLPGRSSSVGDLVTNTIGGILGAAFFHLAQSRFFPYFPLLAQPRKKLLSPLILLLSNCVYLVLLVSLFISLIHASNFSTWDTTFPLLIGNERTGDRPWDGQISQVYIANQSLTESKISQILEREQSRDLARYPWMTSYPLIGSGNYPDKSKHLPDLVWQGTPPITKDEKMISVSQKHWLATQGPATELIQAIQETSQFTLFATIATSDLQQTGPARIISISTDSYSRNLTVGQQGSQLVVRLRTLVSGANGSAPELIFPGIFTDTNSHQLLLTYDNSTLRLYFDGVEQSDFLTLSPEILFFRFLPTICIPFEVSAMNHWLLKGLFYILVCILPITLGIITINGLALETSD